MCHFVIHFPVVSAVLSSLSPPFLPSFGSPPYLFYWLIFLSFNDSPWCIFYVVTICISNFSWFGTNYHRQFIQNVRTIPQYTFIYLLSFFVQLLSYILLVHVMLLIIQYWYFTLKVKCIIRPYILIPQIYKELSKLNSKEQIIQL